MLIRWMGRLWTSILLVTAFFVCNTSAQGPTTTDVPLQQDPLSSQNAALRTGVLVIKLYSESTSIRLERQAVLKLTNLADNLVTWQTTDNTSQSVFTNIPYGRYELEASQAGYFTTHNAFELLDSSTNIEVVLRRDPSAINVSAADSVSPPRARKLTKKAISQLKSDHLSQAQKELDQAYLLVPANPDLNYLLGYLYFKKGDVDKAGGYLSTVSNVSPQNAEALTLLGRVSLEREDYPAARSALERAVLLDFENWLPHSLLADTYLRQSEYEKARDEAEIAILKGDHAASLSRLILGQSLLALGRNHEAEDSLDRFLKESPQHPMAGQVRDFIATMQVQVATTPFQSTSSGVHISELDPLAMFPAPGLPAKSWQPRGIDEVKPFIAQNVVCPFKQLLDETGNRANQLVQNVERFAAVEDLLHQTLDDYGIPTRSQTRKYNYVASISEPQSGILNVDEYRAEKLTLEGYPDHIASTGFAALALVFHPHMRDSFAMSCEGLGDWHGQATWLVHFRQRGDRPNHIHAYKLGQKTYPIALKGRAWISADNSQIMRIEAEMVNPVPEIRLLSEHQIVEYGPVSFPKKNTTVWLPKNAEIYFDFRKHRYFRRHSFDHFMLYSVETDEKRKEPELPSS